MLPDIISRPKARGRFANGADDWPGGSPLSRLFNRAGCSGVAGCWVVPVAVAVGAPVSAAYAQTAAAPGAQPVVGQVSLATSPLSQVQADNQPRFSIVPSVRTVYDSNILRNYQEDGRPSDNVRVTPGIDLSLRRLLGRVSLGATGSIGYDFNSRFRYLDRSRIDMTGVVRAPVGAVCQFDFDARYQRFQFDLGDTQQTGGSAQQNQTYRLSSNCRRAAGFAPLAAVSYSSLTSGGSGFFDFEQFGVEAGVSYTKPSIGTVSLFGNAQRLRRPNIRALIGTEDGTDVRSLSLGLARSVSPRIQFNIAAGITEANPARPGVSTFVGASYNSQINWLITPRFTVNGSAVRAVTNQNGISATYVIREDYGLSVNWQASGKSRFRLSGARTQRDFRGENLNPGLTPIRADETMSIGAGYNYDTLRNIRIGFAVSHRWRDADNPIYDYKSTVASTTVGARF